MDGRIGSRRLVRQHIREMIPSCMGYAAAIVSLRCDAISASAPAPRTARFPVGGRISEELLSRSVWQRTDKKLGDCNVKNAWQIGRARTETRA